MSNLNQFMGPITPAVLVNQISTTAWGGVPVHGGNSELGKTYTMGAMTAATLKTVVSVTGSGVLKAFGAYTVDATARTIRMQITLDGVVVFNSNSASISNTGYGGFAVGGTLTVEGYLDQIPFNTSMLLELASSLTETSKITPVACYSTN